MPVPDAASAARPTFRDVFGLGEFRVLWTAQLLSLLGDQLAVVALTWLVYDRSGSALLAAAAYAAGFLPWVVGGPVLAGLADRYPRREVMAACDLARAPLLAAMALPRAPLWLLYLLYLLATLLTAPFNAARAALLPDVVPGEGYLVAVAVTNVTIQTSQVAGFAVGGVLVATLDPSVALGLDAASFALSALLVRLGVRRRPPARLPDPPPGAASPAGPRPRSGPALRSGLVDDARAGAALLWRDPRLRSLTGLGVLCGFYVVAEGLAVPYAGRLGGGPATAGLLLAAGPAGTVVGSVLLARWVPPERRLHWMGPLAVLSCAALLPCALQPGLLPAAGLFAVSGAASGYQLVANGAFVHAVPARSRGQAFGLVQSLMFAAQGAGVALAGAAAQAWPVGAVVAVAGLAGSVAAGFAAASWRRAQVAPAS